MRLAKSAAPYSSQKTLVPRIADRPSSTSLNPSARADASNQFPSRQILARSVGGELADDGDLRHWHGEGTEVAGNIRDDVPIKAQNAGLMCVVLRHDVSVGALDDASDLRDAIALLSRGLGA